jgi:hypothetical protein
MKIKIRVTVFLILVLNLSSDLAYFTSLSTVRCPIRGGWWLQFFVEEGCKRITISPLIRPNQPNLTFLKQFARNKMIWPFG